MALFGLQAIEARRKRGCRGEYFLTGDNRDKSLDSLAFGPVSRERISGEVVAVRKTGERVAGRY